MEWKNFDMVWNGIVWKIFPAMEDGRCTFHTILCPVWRRFCGSSRSYRPHWFGLHCL